MKNTKEKLWHILSVNEYLKSLKTSEAGLSQKNADLRLKKFGKNELPKEKSLSSLKIFINQFRSPLIYILIFAGVISFFLRHLTDAVIIIFAVFINTIFGYFQERKANQALKQLQKFTRYDAKVRRDGRKIKIDSSQLALGDVVFLAAGDKVPADGRLIDAQELKIMEAALTGESEPSLKNTKKLAPGRALAERENMAYFGTLVENGLGMMAVCATGQNTELGKISKLIKETKEEKTPLQVKIAGFSKTLSLIIVFLCLLIFAFGLVSGNDPIEMFITVVALSVAAIPEGLPVAVTIILTLGMRAILKRQALVKKLIAAETLGSVSIICTDKTGTLTEGRMRVARIITADKDYDARQKINLEKIDKEHDLILKISILCSGATIENPDSPLEELKIIGNSTDRAILLAAIAAGFDKGKLDSEYRKLAEMPFDSGKKFMATMHEHYDKIHHQDKIHRHIFVKGAPEKIFDFCDEVMIGGEKKKITAPYLEYLKSKYERLSQKGLRLIALAYKTGGDLKDIKSELNGLVFLGFVAIKDPLRKDAKKLIKECRVAGIRPVIITGDHRLTAKAIFEELGLKTDGNIVVGEDLDKWSDQELGEKIKKIDVYARVEPRHKLRIIDAWQKRGQAVAMVGDGINDAPAIKSADIGIALGDGSDVAKETADIILLDNSFGVIINAIKGGRMIFDNIRKVILYLLSDSFSEIVLIAGSVLFGLPLPITASQILWVNLVADGLPGVAITLEPAEEGIMSEKPRPRNEPLLNREMKILIFIIGVITDLILFGLFLWLLGRFSDINYIRTIIFAALGVDSLLFAFSVRTLRHSIFTQNPLTNKFLVGAVLISAIILMSAIYLPILQPFFKTVPLGWAEWGIVIGLGFLQIILVEIVKHYYIVKSKSKNKRTFFNYAKQPS
ncbi:MAG: HAD-IC family P-type ATPase [Patescibacteria group bacterium]